MSAFTPDILALLRGHRLIKAVRVVQHDETPLGKIELKLRCLLAVGGANIYRFQVRLHHEPSFRDYAYQLFSDHPLLRWDNAPHYPDLSTAPHHFHDESGQVADLPYVLTEIEKWVASH
jgi:hypothetical protein